jgi:hypothetical protein
METQSYQDMLRLMEAGKRLGQTGQWLSNSIYRFYYS